MQMYNFVLTEIWIRSGLATRTRQVHFGKLKPDNAAAASTQSSTQGSVYINFTTQSAKEKSKRSP